MLFKRSPYRDQAPLRHAHTITAARSFVVVIQLELADAVVQYLATWIRPRVPQRRSDATSAVFVSMPQDAPLLHSPPLFRPLSQIVGDEGGATEYYLWYSRAGRLICESWRLSTQLQIVCNDEMDRQFDHARTTISACASGVPPLL